MEASCTSCPARFAVPDDKVRGRKVRIACKRCGAPIVVDGTHLGAAPTAQPSAGTAKPAAGTAAPKPATTAATVTPKPAATTSAGKPAAAAPKPATATTTAGATPNPGATAATPKPGAASPTSPKPGVLTAKPGGAAPKPAVLTAKPGGSASAPVGKPGAAGQDDNDWSALTDSGGKTVAWREPASAGPPSSSAPRSSGPLGAPRSSGPLGAPRPSGPLAAPRPSGPLGAAGASSPQSAPRPANAAKRTMLGGLEPPKGAAPAPAAADKLPSAGRPAPPAKPALDESADAEPEWTVALTDDQHEEMRTGEVVELYARGSIDQETFIWADGMEDWKRPWEIPMIAAALAGRGLEPKPGDDETEDDDTYPMDEAHEDEATIVASLGVLGPPSSRGKIPSGVWHEPGREEEVGFEDVTVSLDRQSAQGLLASLAGAPREAQKSKPEVMASAFDDVPTTVHEEMSGPPTAPTADVDDLLSYMEERTLAMEDGFLAESRPMSAADLLGEEDTTLEQPRLAAPGGDSFSLDTLMSGTPENVAVGGQPGDLFAGINLAEPPAGRDRPLDSLWEPTGIQQQPSSPISSQGPMSMPGSGGYASPSPMAQAAAPAKKSRLGCVVVLLLLVLVVGGGAAASFFLKQPASLYGADGMPKIPGLSR
ncbi:MAG: zinc-ribbon domain-containing protein [Myxococcales bacterium]|nr:zinc-ribbon domain-containing protein [Myxococcales bacterium]